MGESLLILIVGVGKNMGQPADLTKGVVGCSPRVGIPGSNLEKKIVSGDSDHKFVKICL